MKRRKQSKIDTSKKAGSLAFFTSIPVAYLLAASGLWALASYALLTSVPLSRLALFAVGIITPIGALLSSRPTYIKTLIHESKHAALVILSGNKLTDMNVSRDSGLVSYEIFDQKRHFGPFILLAPYFFPIFSLPTLLICIVTDLAGTLESPELLVALLGMALATDTISSYLEFHPHQTDLKRVVGGRLFVLAFLLGVNLMWITVCLLYAAGGLNALNYAALRTVYIALNMIAPA